MKAKLITAAALTLAGLGAIASNSVLPTDSQRSEPGPAEGPQSVRVEKQPVETPKSTSIEWMKEHDAWATDKWVWVHVTDAPNCAPCEVAEQLQKEPIVAGASQEFACVLMCWCDPDLRDRIRQYRVGSFPADILISPDRKTMLRWEGCPSSADDYSARLTIPSIQEK